MPLTTGDFNISGKLDAKQIFLNGEELAIGDVTVNLTQHIPNYLLQATAIGATEALYAEATDTIYQDCCVASSRLYKLSDNINNTGADKVEPYAGEGTWKLQNIILYTKVGNKLFICGEWVRIL